MATIEELNEYVYFGFRCVTDQGLEIRGHVALPNTAPRLSRR